MKRLIIFVLMTVNLSAQYYSLDINQTGVNHLIVISDTITSLQEGDEIGIFDEYALTNEYSCLNEYGNLLVGAGVWSGDQLNLEAIGSLDDCPIGGVQQPGYVNGNAIQLRVYSYQNQIEYNCEAIFSLGGTFGDLFSVISEINVIENISGCTDPFALNYNPEPLISNDCECDYLENGEYSLQFDGVNGDYVSIPDSESLRPETITIGVWVKSSDFGNGDNKLVAKANIDNAMDGQYTLYISDRIPIFNIKRESNCGHGRDGGKVKKCRNSWC